jgi:flagellar hook-associated protein 3 FlgL
MRVNPNQYSDMLSLLSTVTASEQTTLKEMASGSKINKPSDDPAGDAALIQLQSAATANTQYESNVSTLTSRLSTADSALSSVVTALQSAISVGTEGATSTVNASQRSSLADEITSIKTEVMGLANTSYNGAYLFAGTATQTKPYVADSSSSSGVTYKGNTTSDTVTIGENQTITSTVSGSSIFAGGGNDIFAALNNLATALSNNDTTAIASANTALNTAYSSFVSARTAVGNTLSRLQTASTTLSDNATQITTSEDSISAADMSVVATNLVQQETGRQALLQSISKVSQKSLMDYLTT